MDSIQSLPILYVVLHGLIKKNENVFIHMNIISFNDPQHAVSFFLMNVL